MKERSMGRIELSILNLSALSIGSIIIIDNKEYTVVGRIKPDRIILAEQREGK